MGKVYLSLSMSLDGFITGHNPRPEDRRRTAGAIRTLPRLLMSVLNATIVNVAPPSIQEHLGYSRTRVDVGCGGCAGSMPS